MITWGTRCTTNSIEACAVYSIDTLWVDGSHRLKVELPSSALVVNNCSSRNIPPDVAKRTTANTTRKVKMSCLIILTKIMT